MRRALLWAGVLAAVVVVFVGARTALAQLRPRGPDVPTAAVQRGQVDTSVHAIGEFRSTKSELLSAPAAGTQLRILKLRPTGSGVKVGEVVVEFDPSEQEFQVEQQRSQLREAELEIVKLEAERASQTAQDDVDLLTARFDVRKAELDVKGNELLSSIDARKRELTLEETRRRLAQLEEDVRSRVKSSEAAMAVAAEKRNKARIVIDQAQRLLDQMQLRATLDGIVAIRENREGNFGFWGMTYNEYREGDTVSSGRPMAEILSQGQIEVSAKVAEADRGRIAKGQVATVKLDASRSDMLRARVKEVGAIGGTRMFGPPQGPTRQFDVMFALDSVLPTLRPGLTAQVTVAGDPLKNVLYVPRQAVFDRAGKPTVYVKSGERFEPREVKVVSRTASIVVLEQLAEGTEIALTDPTRKDKQAATPAAGAPTRVVGGR